ncbi:lycopene beta-cyclase [Novosphingobium chloroacetimidivorans]|uniref:Lycopene beta-cyclase n=1 Tax=Novosphingobium chloroacetimidivorans TaxID=1428314 RepID=A0A7W7NVM7_9SPHN|nr:lycopene beta-cyclase CrtY [Novosphingobium chloroacetimidivorans]MBB4857270.1 lycopene beta-cyclase [Novosphingobium chloroacetimidivorans]
MSAPSTDIAILGGGLSGGLIALALAARRPELRVTLFEAGTRCGGDHVWSYFASDLGDGAELLEPLVAARWDGYFVRFPRRQRALRTAYRSVTSERLDAVLRSTLPAEALLTGAMVTEVTRNAVTLADGRIFSAHAVIDARGAAGLPHMAGGWQKFAGQMLRLKVPHGLTHPIVMDASVAQADGYRFVYALPFTSDAVFVEDTYYSDVPELDLPVLRQRIAAYAAAQDWRVEAIEYEETGVLPVVGAGDFDAFWKAGREPGVARAGARAGLLHPLTSYSLPIALRLAVHLCTLDKLSGDAVEEACHAWAREHWRQGRFYRMLTAMLFGAAAPDQRYKVLERFYGLSEPLIERFYAGQSSPADMLRILAGKPPVPLGAAIASLRGKGRPLAPLGNLR